MAHGSSSAFLNQLHAAFRAVARGVLDDFRVHGAGVLVCMLVCRRWFFAPGQGERGGSKEPKQNGCEERLRFHDLHIVVMFDFALVLLIVFLGEGEVVVRRLNGESFLFRGRLAPFALEEGSPVGPMRGNACPVRGA